MIDGRLLSRKSKGSPETIFIDVVRYFCMMRSTIQNAGEGDSE
jgi:hypothetical protein